MAENIDDLSIEYTEDEKLIVKQLEKNVLTRGNWTTIMFLFQEMDKNTGEYGQPRVSIRRYQKRGGVYRQQSKFNISSGKQAKEVSSALLKWFPMEPEDYEREKEKEEKAAKAAAKKAKSKKVAAEKTSSTEETPAAE